MKMSVLDGKRRVNLYFTHFSFNFFSILIGTWVVWVLNHQVHFIHCLGHCALLHCYMNKVITFSSKHIKQLNFHVNQKAYPLNANLTQGSLNN